MTDLENKKHEMTDAERETIEKIGWAHKHMYSAERRHLSLLLELVLPADNTILLELCNQVYFGFLKTFVSKNLSSELFLFTSLFLKYDYRKNKRNVVRFLALVDRFSCHIDSVDVFDGTFSKTFVAKAFGK